MRAYFIRITRKDTDEVLKFYTSFKPDGSDNGAALRVEWDIPVYSAGAAAGNARVKVYGVDLPDIRASSDLNDADITVYGGMSKGFPLAYPEQAGILFKGSVFQAFGNWIGKDSWLEMFLISKEVTANLSYTWTQGTQLESAVRQVLGAAYPGKTITGSFSPSLVYTEDQPFAYQNLAQLGKFAGDVSKSIITDPNYHGAQIVSTANGFTLTDGTKQPTDKQISFYSLVGQPTWLEPGVMQFMCVTRADLNVGDVVQMSKGTNVANTPAGYSRFVDTTSFQGLFQIRNIRHVGDSRQLDATSWVTVIDAYLAAKTT